MQDRKNSVCANVAQRMRRDIELGIIAEGEKLPSCRELAHALGVNPNTVQKAYTVLEQEGYIQVIPQKGAYAHKAPLNAADYDLIKHAEKQLSALKEKGLKLEELKAVADKIYGVNNNDRN